MGQRGHPRELSGHPAIAVQLRHQARQSIQDRLHPEAVREQFLPETLAEVLPQAATDRRDRIGHPQAATTPPVLHQEAQAATLQAGVQARTLRAVQAAARQATPAVVHPEVVPVALTAVEAAQEAAAEEGNH